MVELKNELCMVELKTEYMHIIMVKSLAMELQTKKINPDRAKNRILSIKLAFVYWG